MKKYLLLSLFLFIAKFSTCQVKNEDVVYLKNGSIMRGIIIEQIPEKSIKIQTPDKNIHAYQIDEIEKILRENSNKPKQKKGFIGHSFGVAVPTNDFTAGRTKVGLQIGVLNFGYLFIKNVGISAKLFGASNSTSDTGVFSYGAFLIGPLFSIQPAEKVQTDLRPMLGYAYSNFDYYHAHHEVFSFAFSVGIQNRFHVNNTVSVLVGIDSYFTKTDISDQSRTPRVGIISPEFGLVFRLR